MPKAKVLKLPRSERGTHYIVPSLLQNRIKICLVGAGGNGSQMLSGLTRLHLSLLSLGHPGGLHVTLFDPDFVSESNIGRQLFYPSDVSQPKAFVLIHRINMAFGFDWEAECELFGVDPADANNADMIISCVDTAKSRRSLHQLFDDHYRKPYYWLDLGNRRRDGQVILGQPSGSMTSSTITSAEWAKGLKPVSLERMRLPCITDIFPDLLDARIEEDNEPSCSLAESLQKQDLFINQHIASWGLHLLWNLFRQTKIQEHGYFINLETGRVNPLNVPSHIGAHMTRTRRIAA